MRVAITGAVLDALNSGSHHLRDVRIVRNILEAAGVEVEVHPLERAEANRLRKLAAQTLAEAEALEGIKR